MQTETLQSTGAAALQADQDPLSSWQSLARTLRLALLCSPLIRRLLLGLSHVLKLCTAGSCSDSNRACLNVDASEMRLESALPDVQFYGRADTKLARLIVWLRSAQLAGACMLTSLAGTFGCCQAVHRQHA